jgi:hypothetical protein
LRDLANLRASLREELDHAREQIARLDGFVRRGEGMVDSLDRVLRNAAPASTPAPPPVQAPQPNATEEDDFEARMRGLPVQAAIKLPLRRPAEQVQTQQQTEQVKREGTEEPARGAVEGEKAAEKVAEPMEVDAAATATASESVAATA